MKSSRRLINQRGTRIPRFARRLSMVVALSLSAAVQHAQAATVRSVALSDHSAPGTPSGVNYRDFNAAYFVLNDAGQVAFVGFITGGGVDGLNNEGIWSEGSGSLALVARKGSHAPGAPSGVNFFNFYSPVLNNAGQTLFGAGLIDSTYVPNGQGIWSAGTGSLALVARDASLAPGMPNGVNFTGFGGALLNDAGQTAFRAGLTGSGVDDTNNEGIWSEGSGSLALVARTGSQARGTPSGVNHAGLSLPVLNDAGQTAFFGFLTGSGMDFANDQGIWSEGSGSLALVARSGSQAPGMLSGVNYAGFSDPDLNNAGHTAFWGYLEGSGAGGPYNDGIWSESSGSLALVARRGSQAPGTPNGVNFGNEALLTFDSPKLNDNDGIAFRGFISGPGVDSTNNEGIWSGAADSLALVARTGSQAPGTPSGVNFSSFFPSHGALQLNEAGQSAFAAFLAGSGVGAPFQNDSGIWATNRSGELQLIARIGDLLEVAPGDFRTIRELSLAGAGTGNSDGRPSGFNNLGQLAFWASFNGGSGIFVSNVVAVPEPASLALLALGLPLFAWRNSLRKNERRNP